MIYKTIRAKRFYNFLYEEEKNTFYQIKNYVNQCSNGYFLIYKEDNDIWRVANSVGEGVWQREEYIQNLPILHKLKLCNFLWSNFGNNRVMQKILEKIIYQIKIFFCVFFIVLDYSKIYIRCETRVYCFNVAFEEFYFIKFFKNGHKPV